MKRFLTYLRAGVIEQLSFRLGTFVILLGNIIYLIIVYFLWQAIYESSGVEVVNGMTFNDTMIYLVLATAMNSFMENYLVWEIGRDIQSGRIILDLLKPMQYERLRLFTLSGSMLVGVFLCFLPTAVIVYFITSGAIPLGLNILYFVASALLAVFVNYFINFMVATICLYTESIWGINIMKEVVISLLSGATVPLAFFPDWLRNIVMYLPFQAIYNAPMQQLIGSSLSTQERFKMLGVQLFWAVTCCILSKLFWKVSIKKITINGG